MRRYLGIGLLLSFFAGFTLAADDVAGGGGGAVKSVDKGAKTVVVKTSEGTEHTFHFIGRTVAHGAVATAKGSKDAFEGMKEGDDVVVHYTVKGTEKTAEGAEETYHISDRAVKESGKGLEKAGKVTVYYTDDAGKKVVHFFK